MRCALKVLSMRMTCDEGVELPRPGLAPRPAARSALDPRLERRQATLPSSGAAPALANGSPAEVGERRAAPERECVVQLAPARDQALEPLGVELTLVDTDEISGRARLDPVGADGAPGARGRAPGARSWALAGGDSPQIPSISRSVETDCIRLAGGAGQATRAASGRRARTGIAVVAEHLQRPQQPELH